MYDSSFPPSPVLLAARGRLHTVSLLLLRAVRVAFAWPGFGVFFFFWLGIFTWAQDQVLLVLLQEAVTAILRTSALLTFLDLSLSVSFAGVSHRPSVGFLLFALAIGGLSPPVGRRSAPPFQWNVFT